MIHNVLTIAGSDPSGGAGIQADLKTFTALGAYGCSVITALTAQNTVGVQDVWRVPPSFVSEQLKSVFDDVRIDGVKCGMLMDADIIDVVAAALRHHRPPVFVLDTVMVAKSGDALLRDEAVDALRRELIPLADLITPNLPEAAALLGCDEATNEDEMRAQARALRAMGAKAVLLKGGHLANSDVVPDWLVTADDERRYANPRIATRNTHGTGCTLSAALAAIQPACRDWQIATEKANAFLHDAICHADDLQVGRGCGPVNHLNGQLTMDN